VSEQVRKYIPGRYEVLGTDGFGRSDSRAALRDFFEVDANFINKLNQSIKIHFCT
jgi:pyruvate dehydrogenase E1 component